MNYFIPMLMLSPDDKANDLIEGSFELLIRKWEVSIFDLATLATKHKLHLPYEIMSVFLNQCNMELLIHESDFKRVKIEANIMKAMLYLNGVAPFVCPYISTHSLNDYAGINSRDSEILRAKLPEGLRYGLTSENANIEVWPFELTFQTIRIGKNTISNEVFKKAVNDLNQWEVLLNRYPVLNNIQNTLTAAPFIPTIEQSLLHIWTAIESLFSSINQEISFRLALYITQLNEPKDNRYEYLLSIKRAYATRSKIAHGTAKNITISEWETAWNLLIEICQAIINRKSLPDEKDLLKELLLV
jgi:hypothetical protein